LKSSQPKSTNKKKIAARANRPNKPNIGLNTKQQKAQLVRSSVVVKSLKEEEPEAPGASAARR
jgi:hypothetical protein